ncbi:MAG: hypothetical protein Q4B77_02450 [Coriobacteriaceae bacterium]|nr:hypothetical protein [Coriobacteriaceae bacterium]
MDFMRIDSSVFCPHSFGSLLTERDVHELVPGLCVVCEELCFLQAASSLDALRLSELGYKLCGMYETSLSHDGSLGFTSRPPLTSRSSIQLYLEQHAGFKGVKKARKALARVRDHSRSPMETALAMMICLPRRLGGLGYRGIDMNVRIEIPEHLRTITTSNHLEVDIYAAQKHIGIEYDGEVHAPAQQRARDAERHTVLAALGIRTHVITRVQFSEQLALHRALNAVALDLNIPVDSSAAFQDAQNKLRLHFIREWKRANGSE